MSGDVIFKEGEQHKVADTSKDSYKKLKEGDDKEKSQAKRILDALEALDYLPTANELNKGPLADMSIPNGRVSARLNYLMDEGLVKEMGKREDKWTGRKAKTYVSKRDMVEDELGEEFARDME